LEKKFFDATFAFSAGTAAGQFPSSDDGLKIYLYDYELELLKELVIE